MGTGRQVNLFIAIGVAMVFVDLATYRSLLWGGLGIDLAKGIGYCVGTICAYSDRPHTRAAKPNAYRSSSVPWVEPAYRRRPRPTLPLVSR